MYNLTSVKSAEPPPNCYKMNALQTFKTLVAIYL